MSIHYLKFASQEEWLSNIPSDWISDGDFTLPVDVVGVIFHTDTESETPGFHVNVLGDIPTELSAFEIAAPPSQPKRIFC